MAQTKSVLKTMASIDWGSTIRWHIEFPADELPAPFQKFIPAQTITFGHASVTDLDVQNGNTSYKLPFSAEAQTAEVVFLDNDEDVVLQYMEDWATYLTEGGTATIDEAQRQMLYAKAKNTGVETVFYLCDVYPTGVITSEMGETAGVRKVTVTFNIVSRSKVKL